MLRFTYHSRSSDCGWTAWEQVTIVISLQAEGYLGQRSQSFINISVVTQSAVRLVTVILVRWFGCLSLGLQSNGCDFFCTADCFQCRRLTSSTRSTTSGDLLLLNAWVGSVLQEFHFRRLASICEGVNLHSSSYE